MTAPTGVFRHGKFRSRVFPSPSTAPVHAVWPGASGNRRSERTAVWSDGVWQKSKLTWRSTSFDFPSTFSLVCGIFMFSFVLFCFYLFDAVSPDLEASFSSDSGEAKLNIFTSNHVFQMTLLWSQRTSRSLPRVLCQCAVTRLAVMTTSSLLWLRWHLLLLMLYGENISG